MKRKIDDEEEQNKKQKYEEVEPKIELPLYLETKFDPTEYLLQVRKSFEKIKI